MFRNGNKFKVSFVLADQKVRHSNRRRGSDGEFTHEGKTLMLCYFAACRFEDDLKEAGIPVPERRRLIDHFPLVRLKKNIAAVNEYTGLDLTEFVINAHLVSPIKAKLSDGVHFLHSLLDALWVREDVHVREILNTLDLKIYRYKNKYRPGIKGFKRKKRLARKSRGAGRK